MKEELIVADKYRTNQLSLEPGGYQVTIIHQDGKPFVYDKIKNPVSYVRYISRESKANGKIVEILIEGNTVWKEGVDIKNDWNITL